MKSGCLIFCFTALFGVILLTDCGTSPIEPDSENPAIVLEESLAKIGQDVTAETTDRTKVSKRLRRALGELEGMLKRIRAHLGDNRQATRYLRAAYKTYRESVSAYKDDDFRTAIQKFRDSKKFAGGAIRSLRGLRETRTVSNR